MRRRDNKGWWTYREAKRVSRGERFFLAVLVMAGFISMLRLADWWFREGHVANLALYILLSCIFWYGMVRIVLIWINYLHIRKPEAKPAPPGLTVAIFTTSSPGEPLSMFEKTLEACSRVSYPHTTYLLDDTRDPRFREVAEKHNAVWLELAGLPGAKAGKINKALSLTKEDFILVLDPDHIPFANFLDQVLGFFDDATVGYVQVAQAYLESAGGHGIGLAEDLITAIRIHAAGWKSIYYPVIVSRGLVPEDFGSFCKQQLKWARGVHEVLFAEVPRLFKKLSFWQRISYLTIGTYYLEGLITLLYLVIPFLSLLLGITPAKMYFIEFLLYGMPVLIFSVLIYLYVQRWMCHPQVERGLHWRGMILKFACWPVFFLGFILSLVDADIPYIPTAKQAVLGKISPFARPLVIHIVIFLFTIAYVIYERRYIVPEATLVLTSEKTYGMICFATLSFLLALGGMYAALESQNMTPEDPWASVDSNRIMLEKIKTLEK